jgi:MFS family permease
VSAPRLTRPSAQARAPQRPGVAMAVIMSGVLMTAVDTTIVVLALPEIQRGLHVALSAVVWVIISFLLVITLLATQVGRLGDMFGRVPGTRRRSSPSASCRG